MSLESWRLAVDVTSLLALLISMGAGYYAWQVSRRQLHRAEVDEKVRRVHGRVDQVQQGQSDVRDRVARVERALEETPTAQMVHELSLSITTLGGDLKSISSELQGMRALVERQEKVTTRLEDYVRQVESERRRTP